MVFAGWMLPVLLARFMPERVAAAAPEAVRLFRVIGGVWAFAAVAYGLVIAMRVRRGIAD